MSKIDDARARTKTPIKGCIICGVYLSRLFCDVCGVTTWHTADGYCVNCPSGGGLREFGMKVVREARK